MVASCRCGEIVDGGDSGLVAGADPFDEGRKRAVEWLRLMQAMSGHVRARHPEAQLQEVLQAALWVESSKYFTSSDPMFLQLRNAARLAFTEGVMCELPPVVIGG